MTGRAKCESQPIKTTCPPPDGHCVFSLAAYFVCLSAVLTPVPGGKQVKVKGWLAVANAMRSVSELLLPSLNFQVPSAWYRPEISTPLILPLTCKSQAGLGEVTLACCFSKVSRLLMALLLPGRHVNCWPVMGR